MLIKNVMVDCCVLVALMKKIVVGKNPPLIPVQFCFIIALVCYCVVLMFVHKGLITAANEKVDSVYVPAITFIGY